MRTPTITAAAAGSKKLNHSKKVHMQVQLTIVASNTGSSLFLLFRQMKTTRRYVLFQRCITRICTAACVAPKKSLHV